MNITIMHLYYDLMNLYGENGNIKAMKSYLESLGVKVKIKFSTLNDDIILDDVDLIYIGSGTEQSEILALKHLKKYKNNLNDFINCGKFIIATGNSFELFGKSLTYKNKKYDCLGIFNYDANVENFRIVDEIIATTNLIDIPIIGFVNHNSVIKNINNPLFKIIKGTGNFPKSEYEGFNFQNFYGSYLIGPLLARNPELLKCIMNKLINSKDKDFKIKEVDLSIENNAYLNYIKKYNIKKDF